MLEPNIERWKNELVQKGIRQREEIGLTDQKTTLLEMLSDRFGDIPTTWRNSINALTSVQAIRELTRYILKVKSADEYGQMLMGMTKVQ